MDKLKKDKKTKKNKLYLSDRRQLSFAGIIGLIFTYIILIAWAFIIIWPLFQMVMSAFNGNQERYLSVNRVFDINIREFSISFADSFEFSLRHFEHLFLETNFLNWTWNTIFIAGSTAILTVIIVSFTGYAYSRYRFKGRKASLMLIMLIQTIPTFAGITAFFTMHSIIQSTVPIFTRQMMLILIYTGGAIASNTFILKGYIDSISTELDDSAKIDGCSNMQIYRLIIMPVAKPMLILISLWSFIGPFMDFLLPRVLLTNVEDYTLAAGLFTLVSDDRTINQPAFAAGGLLTAIPIVILFMLLQKHLTSGLAKGSVKG